MANRPITCVLHCGGLHAVLCESVSSQESRVGCNAGGAIGLTEKFEKKASLAHFDPAKSVRAELVAAPAESCVHRHSNSLLPQTTRLHLLRDVGDLLHLLAMSVIFSDSVLRPGSAILDRTVTQTRLSSFVLLACPSPDCGSRMAGLHAALCVSHPFARPRWASSTGWIHVRNIKRWPRQHRYWAPRSFLIPDSDAALLRLMPSTLPDTREFVLYGTPRATTSVGSKPSQILRTKSHRYAADQ